MKKAMLKAIFGISVLTTWMLLFSLGLVAIEILFPVRRRPDGLYPNTDRMPLVMIAMGLGLFIANQAVSRLFLATSLSDERWSVFGRRRP